MARHRTKNAGSGLSGADIATIAAIPPEELEKFTIVPGVGLYPRGDECPHCVAQRKKFEELSKK